MISELSAKYQFGAARIGYSVPQNPRYSDDYRRPSPSSRRYPVAYSCFGPEISPSATFQITNFVGYG